MRKILMNGWLCSEDEAMVSINDRGYNFGDGVYEVARFYDGQFFMIDEHLLRFKRSVEELGIQFEYSLEDMKSEWEKLAETSGYNSGYIYSQITRGVSKRDHLYIGKEMETQYIAYAVQEEDRPFETMEKGIKVLLTEDIRWLRCDIKSLNLLGSVMAKNKAASVGAKEAVLIRDGKVTEGSATNVFVVKDNVLYTHPANNLILNGITRMAVLELAKSAGIEVMETDFSVEFFKDADEAFTTTSVSEIMPIIRYDMELSHENSIEIGSGKRGPVTKQIQDLYSQKISN